MTTQSQRRQGLVTQVEMVGDVLQEALEADVGAQDEGVEAAVVAAEVAAGQQGDQPRQHDPLGARQVVGLGDPQAEELQRQEEPHQGLERRLQPLGHPEQPATTRRLH